MITLELTDLQARYIETVLEREVESCETHSEKLVQIAGEEMNKVLGQLRMRLEEEEYGKEGND